MKEVLNFVLIEWGDYKLTIGNLVAIALIFIGTKLLVWLINKAFEKRFTSDKDELGRKYTLSKLTGYVIWTFALLLMFQSAGIKITLLLAGSAALLVGIGLGLQQTFQDFISGLILLLDRTIEINDVIEMEGMVARVEHIGLRTSILVTRDDIAVIVPNSKITTSNVINWSHTKKKPRFHIDVGVAYGSNEDLVKSVLLVCAREHPEVLKEPSPFIRLEEFANSSVNFKLYFWTKDAFRVENIKSDLRFLIIKKLRENNITIPFPQMDIYVKEIPGK